jgi:hypothetical protein
MTPTKNTYDYGLLRLLSGPLVACHLTVRLAGWVPSLRVVAEVSEVGVTNPVTNRGLVGAVHLLDLHVSPVPLGVVLSPLTEFGGLSCHRRTF